jgi:demethylmenaquinone methyltransferase/2-methoxy-6-polyprenyl-1,4-benzoquinol methylase
MKEYAPAGHRRLVEEIFSTIHHRYDLLNHVLSLGLDIYWRKFAISKLKPSQRGTILDLACGTGDMAIEACHRYPYISVLGVDFSPEMLEVAQKKILEKGLFSRIHLLRGDALKLPFSDNVFDMATVAFGIRNISPTSLALKELVRVCRPGAKVLILEMHDPSKRAMRLFFRLYARTILPLGARLASNNAAAYEYLVNSIIQFPPPMEFKILMKRAGLTQIQQFSLFPGITYLHCGVKSGGPV